MPSRFCRQFWPQDVSSIARPAPRSRAHPPRRCAARASTPPSRSYRIRTSFQVRRTCMLLRGATGAGPTAPAAPHPPGTPPRASGPDPRASRMGNQMNPTHWSTTVRRQVLGARRGAAERTRLVRFRAEPAGVWAAGAANFRVARPRAINDDGSRTRASSRSYARRLGVRRPRGK